MSRPPNPPAFDPEEFTGDPIESISGLLLLLGKPRLENFAREKIAEEVERYLAPVFAENKSVVSMEHFQRVQEAYAMNYWYNNVPKNTKHYVV
jgi:hypothetical protein